MAAGEIPVEETLKRVGRPMKPPTPGKRTTLSLMVSPEVKQRIDAAARESGRSQSQEAERRIEMSYNYERVLPVEERLDRIEELLRNLLAALIPMNERLDVGREQR